jgi:hypothetical protein
VARALPEAIAVPLAQVCAQVCSECRRRSVALSIPARMWEGVSPVLVQMWVGVPVLAQMWVGVPVPAQMWVGVPVPAQMWHMPCGGEGG